MSQLIDFFIRRLNSFKYAINGILYNIKTQTNFKIHLIATAIVLSFSIYFKLSKTEWLFTITAIFFVLIAEVINTIVEEIMNYISPQFNKKVGLIKDMSAGAVLLAAIYSVAIGLIIFLPKFIALAKSIFNFVFFFFPSFESFKSLSM